jgi:predicted esterase
VSAGTADRAPRPIGAVAALGVLAQGRVEIHPGLAHVEAYTFDGLLTVLWHEPVAPGDAAIVLCGGAMGGLLGPGHALYHRIGERWSSAGVRVLRVSYRRPNDLDACTVDVAATVEMAVDAGARRAVLMGHSFGGAVAIRAAVALGDLVAGVATFATQSAGCELAGALAGRPLLLFHGDRDEILPLQASEVVRAIAGTGELVVLPGDGHLLAKSDAVLTEHLDAWLPATLPGVAAPA